MTAKEYDLYNCWHKDHIVLTAPPPRPRPRHLDTADWGLTDLQGYSGQPQRICLTCLSATIGALPTSEVEPATCMLLACCQAPQGAERSSVDDVIPASATAHQLSPLGPLLARTPAGGPLLMQLAGALLSSAAHSKHSGSGSATLPALVLRLLLTLSDAFGSCEGANVSPGSYTDTDDGPALLGVAASATSWQTPEPPPSDNERPTSLPAGFVATLFSVMAALWRAGAEHRTAAGAATIILSDLAESSPAFCLAVARHQLPTVASLLAECVAAPLSNRVLEVYLFLIYYVSVACASSTTPLDALAIAAVSGTAESGNGLLHSLCEVLERCADDEALLSNVLSLTHFLVSLQTVSRALATSGSTVQWPITARLARLLTPHLLHPREPLVVLAARILRSIMQLPIAGTVLSISALEWVEDCTTEALQAPPTTPEAASTLVGLLATLHQVHEQVHPAATVAAPVIAKDGGGDGLKTVRLQRVQALLRLGGLPGGGPHWELDEAVRGPYLSHCLRRCAAELDDVVALVVAASQQHETESALPWLLGVLQAVVKVAQEAGISFLPETCAAAAHEVMRRLDAVVALRSPADPQEGACSICRPPEPRARLSKYASAGVPASPLMDVVAFLLPSSDLLVPLATEIMAEVLRSRTEFSVTGTHLSPASTFALLTITADLCTRYYKCREHLGDDVSETQAAPTTTNTARDADPVTYVGSLLRVGLIDVLLHLSMGPHETSELAATADALRRRLVCAVASVPECVVAPGSLQGVSSCAALVAPRCSRSVTARLLQGLAVCGSPPPPQASERGFASLLDAQLAALRVTLQEAYNECSEESTSAPLSGGTGAGDAAAPAFSWAMDTVEMVGDLLCLCDVYARWYGALPAALSVRGPTVAREVTATAEAAVGGGGETAPDQTWRSVLCSPSFCMQLRKGLLALQAERGIMVAAIVQQLLIKVWCIPLAAFIAVAVLLDELPDAVVAANGSLALSVGTSPSHLQSGQWAWAVLGTSDQQRCAAECVEVFLSVFFECARRSPTHTQLAERQLWFLTDTVKAIVAGREASPSHFRTVLTCALETHLAPLALITALDSEPQKSATAARLSELIANCLCHLAPADCSGTDYVFLRLTLSRLTPARLGVSKGHCSKELLPCLQLLYVLLKRTHRTEIVSGYQHLLLPAVRAARALVEDPQKGIVAAGTGVAAEARATTTSVLCALLEHTLTHTLWTAPGLAGRDGDWGAGLAPPTHVLQRWYTMLPVLCHQQKWRSVQVSSRHSRAHLLRVLDHLLRPCFPLTRWPEPLSRRRCQADESTALLAVTEWCVEELFTSHSRWCLEVARLQCHLLYYYQEVLSCAVEVLALWVLCTRVKGPGSMRGAVTRGWLLNGLMFVVPRTPWGRDARKLHTQVASFVEDLEALQHPCDSRRKRRRAQPDEESDTADGTEMVARASVCDMIEAMSTACIRFSECTSTPLVSLHRARDLFAVDSATHGQAANSESCYHEHAFDVILNPRVI